MRPEHSGAIGARPEQRDPPKVLVVDDNRALAENIVEILDDEGIAAGLAESGGDALALIADEGYNLVITDIRMPGMTGIELLQRIREDWPEMPVVVMTAYSSDQALRDAAAAGALCVLSKPVVMDEVVELVARVVAPHTTVLVVEDDDDLRANLAEALLDVANVVPATAPDLATADRMLETLDVQVVIIDARLPDGSGVEWGAELRRRLGDKLTLVFITGYAADYHRALGELLSLPHMHLLEKPFSAAALIDLVRSAG